MRKWWYLLGISISLTSCGGGGGSTADSNPPILSQIELQHTSNGVLVIVVAEDAESGIASVVAVATIGGSAQTFPMSSADNRRYQATLPPNTVRVNVRATDRVGNSRESGSIPAPPPSPPF